MTEKTAWVTDSTGFLDEQLQINEDVFVVPITIHLEGNDYNDGVDISHEELFEAMIERAAVVTTSQPSIGKFQQVYNELASKRYTRIYSFLLSEKLSGTFASSHQASQLVDIPVHTFDSQLLSYPMTYIMKKAISWHQNGDNHNDIIRKAEQLRDSNETYVLIGSLEQLFRSGRLSSVKYYLGSLLKIKPIISLVNGRLEIQDIGRSEKHAEKIIFSKLKTAVEKHSITDCFILFGQFHKQSEEWIQKIKRQYPHLNIHMYPLGTAIGVHAGGNTLGISWFKEKI